MEQEHRAIYTQHERIYQDPTAHFPTGTPVYLAIDLKSFYASVECVERGLDPMQARLVVADPSRSRGTICLAVSPALKALGVKNRCRIYEIPDNLDYIIAPPQMQHYIDCSAEIYEVYLEYIASEDIHVYSIDEAFLDVTHYLSLYRMTAKELAQEIMNAILDKTGIRAACGIGTNLYLTKVALDICAKKSTDFIGILTEDTYQELLWEHKPLTDFWMIGRGIAGRLARFGITTMGALARAALADDSLFYREFGVNAEILIDHAFGVETVTMADIKHYATQSHSLTAGQTLMRDYNFRDAALIVREMMEQLCLDMAAEGLSTDSVTLHISYSHNWELYPLYPHAHGTARAARRTRAAYTWQNLVAVRYEEITRRDAPIRRISLSCNNVRSDREEGGAQYSLFDDDGRFLSDIDSASTRQEQEERMQQAVLEIKHRYGKNAIIKGTSLDPAATARTRNRQIGGHNAQRQE